MKGKNAAKNTKKAPSVNINKTVSDYKAGSASVSKIELTAPNKKK